MQVTGYVCDVCGSYSTDRDTWLSLRSIASAPGDKAWDICSNKCLIRMGRDRQAGEITLPKVNGATAPRPARRTFSPEFKAEVVDYALETTAEQAALHYNMNPVNVYRWIKLA